MFRRIALGGLFLAAFSLVFSNFFAVPTADAAKKKRGVKKEAPVSAQEREKKILGWTSDYPTAWTYTRPDFFVRGTVLDFKQVPDSKEWEILILPIEVLNNPQHHITMEHFKNGVAIRIELQPSEKRGLKKGGVVEYNQYSKEFTAQDVGHAKLISQENFTDFKPYDVSPVAYITKPGMEPEQMVNAIRGVLLYNGSVPKDDALKTSLSALAKHNDPTVAQPAKECSAKLFGQ